MFKIQELSYDKIKKWEAFTSNHQYGNYFQSYNGYNFFLRVPDYTPVVLLATKAGEVVGSLIGVLLTEKGVKGFFSKRCIIWGGPIINADKSDEKVVTAELLAGLNKFHNAIYTEFRNFHDTKAIESAFLENGYLFHEHLNYVVSVKPGEEESLQLLSSSKRRQVRKSLKEGAQIKKAESIEEVRAFYSLLLELYQTKVKKPLPSQQFFETFFHQSPGVFLLIYKESELLGGIMCPFDENTIYEWYVAGLDGKYKSIYPSVLATWAPIAYASKIGLKYFDFMGAGRPDEDYGVREFKSKFGGELLAYGRYKKINKPLLYKIGLLGLKILQKIK